MINTIKIVRIKMSINLINSCVKQNLNYNFETSSKNNLFHFYKFSKKNDTSLSKFTKKSFRFVFFKIFKRKIYWKKPYKLKNKKFCKTLQ